MRSLALVMTISVLHPSQDHRALWMRNMHTGEELKIEPFSTTGKIPPIAWAIIDRFFRSWRTGQRRTVNARLIAVLAQIQRHFDGRVIELWSGYRTSEPDTPLHSYHQVGRAADIVIPGVPKLEVYTYCRTLERVGCGYYPNGIHSHVDVRSRSSFWIDPLGGRGHGNSLAASSVEPGARVMP